MNGERLLERQIIDLKRKRDKLSDEIYHNVEIAQAYEDKRDIQDYGNLHICELEEHIQEVETELLKLRLSRYDITIPSNNLKPDFWTITRQDNLVLTEAGRFDGENRLRAAKKEKSASRFQFWSFVVTALALFITFAQIYMQTK
jgi:hypothetical protein